MNHLKQIIDAHPRLFRGEPPVVHSYVMGGWAPIVSRMFGRIDALLCDEQAQQFRVMQLKEKFGQFRIYYRAGPTEDELEAEAEEGDIRVDIQSADRKSPSVTGESGSRTRKPLFDDDLRGRIRDIVEEAIKEASATCEYCSQPGSLRGDEWVTTLCADHDRMRKERTGPWAWTSDVSDEIGDRT
jgi:hypothetical protein